MGFGQVGKGHVPVQGSMPNLPSKKNHLHPLNFKMLGLKIKGVKLRRWVGAHTPLGSTPLVKGGMDCQGF